MGDTVLYRLNRWYSFVSIPVFVIFIIISRFALVHYFFYLIWCCCGCCCCCHCLSEMAVQPVVLIDSFTRCFCCSSFRHCAVANGCLLSLSLSGKLLLLREMAVKPVGVWIDSFTRCFMLFHCQGNFCFGRWLSSLLLMDWFTRC